MTHDATVICADCAWRGPVEETHEVNENTERTLASMRHPPVFSGDCPACGGLASDTPVDLDEA